MRARSTLPYAVRAFGGHEFPSHSWTVVPPGFEDDAYSHPYLEVEEDNPPGGDSPTPPGAPSQEEPLDATDAAVALAEEHDIDLSLISGTGKEGRILLSDVREALGEEEDE